MQENKREEEMECTKFPDTDDEEINTTSYPIINLTSSADKSINLPSIEEEPSEAILSQDVSYLDTAMVKKEPSHDVSHSDIAMVSKEPS